MTPKTNEVPARVAAVKAPTTPFSSSKALLRQRHFQQEKRKALPEARGPRPQPATETRAGSPKTPTPE